MILTREEKTELSERLTDEIVSLRSNVVRALLDEIFLLQRDNVWLRSRERRLWPVLETLEAALRSLDGAQSAVQTLVLSQRAALQLRDKSEEEA